MRIYRELPKNFNEKDKDIFINLEKGVYIPDPEIVAYKNVLLSGFNLFSINKLEFLNKLSMAIDFNLSVISFTKHLLKSIFKNKKIILKQEKLWVINDHCFNYYHWISEALPRLLLLKNNGYNGKIILPSNWNVREYITSSINMLNFDFEYYELNKVYKISNLITSKHLATTGNFNPMYLCELSKYLKTSKSKNSKYWIIRKENQSRRIRNKKDFLKILDKYEIKAIDSENLNFEEEVDLFSKASFIGGLHGAGLANMIFMDQGSKVLEIKTKLTEKSNAFFAMSNALKHDYYYLRSDANEDDGIEINIEEIDSLLAEMFSDKA